MKIIRWLLSHTLLILLIVIVIYGYMFWGNLAGEDTPAGKAISYLSNEFVVVEEFVDAIKDKQAQLSQDESQEPVDTKASDDAKTVASQSASNVQAGGAMESTIADDAVQSGNQPGDQSGSQAAGAAAVVAQSGQSAVQQTEPQAEQQTKLAQAQDRWYGKDSVNQQSQQNDAVSYRSGERQAAYRDYRSYDRPTTEKPATQNVTEVMASAPVSVSKPEPMPQAELSAEKTEQTSVQISPVLQLNKPSQPASSLTAPAKVATDSAEAVKSSLKPQAESSAELATEASAEPMPDEHMPDVAAKPAAAAKSTMQTTAQLETPAAAQLDKQPVSGQQEITASEEKFVPAEIEQQLDTVDVSGRNTKQVDDSAVKESWVKARKSYYQRNYEESEKSYQSVIDNTEDNFDAYGELGNVYFNQGKKQQAANAYFEAAAILVRKGQRNRARSLIGLLRNLDKSKADELKKLIDSTAP